MMPTVTAKISDMSDALKKLKAHSETDVHDAVVFLCGQCHTLASVPELLLGYLKSPRMLFPNSVRLAVDSIVIYGIRNDRDELQEIYDTTKNEDLAIIIGKRLELGTSAPGLAVGDNDDLGYCIKCMSNMYHGSGGEFVGSQVGFRDMVDNLKGDLTPEMKPTMLKVVADNSYESDLVDRLSDGAAVNFRNALDTTREWLANELPTNTEPIVRMVSSSYNGWEILASWIKGLSSVNGEKKDAMAAAKGLLTRNVLAMLSTNHPDTNARFTNEVYSLLSELPLDMARYFGKDIVDRVEAAATPELADQLQFALALPEEKYARIKGNPSRYMDKIQAMLSEPNASGIKDCKLRTIYDILPAIYFSLDQGFIDSLWESGDEATRVAMLQSIGFRWPNKKLLSIYGSGSPQIKAAISKVLSDNKLSYLLPSNDGEM